MLYILTHFLLPLAIIGWLNYAVVKSIVTAQSARRELSNVQKGEHRTAIMMTVVRRVFSPLIST